MKKQIHLMAENLNQEGKVMIHQGFLPFKLKISEEEITPRSGLAIYAEALRELRIRGRVERSLPRPGSNRSYKASRYVEPLLLILYGGGRHIEDLREIRDDGALRRCLLVLLLGTCWCDWVEEEE